MAVVKLAVLRRSVVGVAPELCGVKRGYLFLRQEQHLAWCEEGVFISEAGWCEEGVFISEAGTTSGLV